MATQYIALPPEVWVPDNTNGAQFVVNAGTNFPVTGWAFDGGSTDEIVHSKFRAINYSSGNLAVDVEWYADTATSGNVVFGAAIAVITPVTDSQDVETDAYATANTVQDAHEGTVGQRLHRATITISNLDSLTQDDDVRIKLYRVASDTVNDTISGDVIVTNLTLSYTSV